MAFISRFVHSFLGALTFTILGAVISFCLLISLDTARAFWYDSCYTRAADHELEWVCSGPEPISWTVFLIEHQSPWLEVLLGITFGLLVMRLFRKHFRLQSFWANQN